MLSMLEPSTLWLRSRHNCFKVLFSVLFKHDITTVFIPMHYSLASKHVLSSKKLLIILVYHSPFSLSILALWKDFFNTGHVEKCTLHQWIRNSRSMNHEWRFYYSRALNFVHFQLLRMAGEVLALFRWERTVSGALYLKRW